MGKSTKGKEDIKLAYVSFETASTDAISNYALSAEGISQKDFKAVYDFNSGRLRESYESFLDNYDSEVVIFDAMAERHLLSNSNFDKSSYELAKENSSNPFFAYSYLKEPRSEIPDEVKEGHMVGVGYPDSEFISLLHEAVSGRDIELLKNLQESTSGRIKRIEINEEEIENWLSSFE